MKFPKSKYELRSNAFIILQLNTFSVKLKIYWYDSFVISICGYIYILNNF